MKVVVWGTGNVGRPALRAVVAHAELELVGVVVSSPEKDCTIVKIQIDWWKWQP